MAEISAQTVKALREQTGAGMMDCKRALSDAEGEPTKAIELLRERGLAKAVKRAGRETSEGTIAIALDGAVAGIVELGCETDFVAKTDDFQSLASALAGVAASGADGPDALLAASIDGESVSDKIAAAGSRLGENVVLKRAQRLAVSGTGASNGYVHAGGKLGVIVGLATDGDASHAGALARDLAMHVAAADPTPLAVDRDGVSSELVEKEAELFRRQAAQEGKPEKVIEKIVEGRIRKYYAEVCLLEQPFVKDPDKSVSQVLEDAAGQLGKPISISGFIRFRLGETASE